MNSELYENILSLKNIGDSFIQGICITDKNGIILYVNKANEAIFDIPAEKAVGHSITEFTKDVNPAIQNASSLISFENKDVYHAIATITSNQKNTIQYTTPILNSSKEIIGYLITDQEISKFLSTKKFLEEKENKVLSDKELRQEEFFRRTNPLMTKELPTSLSSENPKYKEALYVARQAAVSDVSVLIHGETGCGKEVFANYIQSLGNRCGKPFIKINCSAIPQNLLESELFGYEKGSFTGANTHGKPGYFELANQGTLFLDEIGELPMEFQVKLLRVLQEKQVSRIGGATPINLDIKFIFATNRNLSEMVDAGTFRKDLYYRINVLPIHIPPLREHLEDIDHLVHFFLDTFNQKYNKHVSLASSVYIGFKNYAWPGNIRELQNILERWVVVHSEYAVIHWPQVSSHFFNDSFEIEYPTRDFHSGNMSYADMMDEYQREILRWAKAEYKTTREMAKALDLDHSTICKKAKRLGIDLNK